MAALRSFAVCLAPALLLVAMPCAVAQRDAPPLRRIDRAGLCITNGDVSAASRGKLSIETPSARAIVRDGGGAADQIAEIRFQYLGPSRDSRRLASGRLRRQIGLKLQAEDGCNLIYAMWRIEPEAAVVVSVKRNPGQHAHSECGARGYVDFRSPGGSGRYPVRPGATHTLRAELRGQDLKVSADGKVAWQGTLAAVAPLPAGPAGLRTDNGRFILEFLSSGSTARHQATPVGAQCTAAGED